MLVFVKAARSTGIAHHHPGGAGTTATNSVGMWTAAPSAS